MSRGSDEGLAYSMLARAGVGEEEARHLVGACLLGLKRLHSWDWYAVAIKKGSVGDTYSLLPTAIAYAIVARQDGMTVPLSALEGVKAAQKLAYADSNVTQTKQWGAIVRGQPLLLDNDGDMGHTIEEKGYEYVEEMCNVTWAMDRIEDVYDEDMATAFYLKWAGWPTLEIAERLDRSVSTVGHWFGVLIPRLFSPLEVT